MTRHFPFVSHVEREAVATAYEKHMARGVRYCAFVTIPDGCDHPEQWAHDNRISAIWARPDGPQWSPNS